MYVWIFIDFSVTFQGTPATGFKFGQAEHQRQHHLDLQREHGHAWEALHLEGLGWSKFSVFTIIIYHMFFLWLGLSFIPSNQKYSMKTLIDKITVG